MARRAGVPCVPWWGVLLGVVYCGGLDGWLLAGVAGRSAAEVPVWWDAACLFGAVAGGFALQLRRPVQGLETLTAVAIHALGFVYVAYLFNFTARLLFAVPGDGELPGGWLLLWVLAVTKFTDMGAYLTGTLCGRHKMIPQISPAKTWEGFAGSLVFALLAGCGMAAWWPDQFAVLGGQAWVAGLSVLLALLAVVGDLAESVVKRSTGSKDSGALLPGIGGALDLIDSICFTAPVLWCYLQWRTG
jgi:phosphatidate cytidylyltransferase